MKHCSRELGSKLSWDVSEQFVHTKLSWDRNPDLYNGICIHCLTYMDSWYLVAKPISRSSNVVPSPPIYSFMGRSSSKVRTVARFQYRFLAFTQSHTNTCLELLLHLPKMIEGAHCSQIMGVLLS